MTDKNVCKTCSGVGLVGGFVTPESGYQDEPCPDCKPATPPKPAPDAMREACAQVADRAALADEEYAAKYPDEAEKMWQRAHRARTIATAIRNCADGAGKNDGHAHDKLLTSAKLLQQNSGRPGWLADTKKDIAAAQVMLDEIDYESAAHALGFLRMEATGHWLHPRDDFALRRCYASAEEIFDRELPGLIPPSPAVAAEPDDDDDDIERCVACDRPFVEGDMVYLDINNGGTLHEACCGPERECYTDADGEPLKDGDPIPKPFRWSPWPTMSRDRQLWRKREAIIERARAAPPVRGDREKLLGVNRLLNKVAGLIDDEDTCDPLDDAIKWANEALAIMGTLSLPVQPGAGEIETAFLNLCNELGLQATPLAYLDANAAHLALLSRQPPHSSREGGR